jgi:hypothetical protein
MRAATTVSGGDKTVASMARVDNAARRSGAPPLAKIVTAWREIFHSLRARVIARSVEPPKLRIPLFLPTRSDGLRISFCAMTLNGNLLSAAAMMTMSPPRRRMGIGALAEPWAKSLLPETKVAMLRVLPVIKTISAFKPCFPNSSKSLAAHNGP